MAVAMAETTENRLTRLESDVAHIRSDAADIKIDMREIRRDLGELRDGSRKEIGALQGDIGELRDEMRREIGGLGDEMRRGFADMHQAMMRADLMTRIWMLLLCAAMLGVMARGLHGL